MDQIVSREEMRARGAKAFDEGRGVDGHNMNWMSPAVTVWQHEWDLCASERSRETGNVQQLEACPP